MARRRPVVGRAHDKTGHSNRSCEESRSCGGRYAGGEWDVGARQAVAKLVQIRLSCSGLCRSPRCADPEGEVGLQFWGQIQILSGEASKANFVSSRARPVSRAPRRSHSVA